MKFDKGSLTVDQHLELLSRRGLSITDPTRAGRYLQTIGYFRLSAYYLPFQDQKDQFNPGTTFDSILDLYIFDRKLRLVAIDALERIEVAIRTVMSNCLSEKYGPHWFLKKEEVFKDEFFQRKNYQGISSYDYFINDIERYTGKKNDRNRNTACKHYYQKYSTPEYPPSWMVIEVLSFGSWSRLYPGIRLARLRTKISNFFKIDQKDFGSWVHAITLIRNACAHHTRLWNRKFPPKAKNVQKYTHPGIPLNTPYMQFALIQSILKSFTNNPTWAKRLEGLLNRCPLNFYKYMKFPAGWEGMHFWN